MQTQSQDSVSIRPAQTLPTTWTKQQCLASSSAPRVIKLTLSQEAANKTVHTASMTMNLPIFVLNLAQNLTTVMITTLKRCASLSVQKDSSPMTTFAKILVLVQDSMRIQSHTGALLSVLMALTRLMIQAPALKAAFLTVNSPTIVQTLVLMNAPVIQIITKKMISVSCIVQDLYSLIQHPEFAHVSGNAKKVFGETPSPADVWNIACQATTATTQQTSVFRIVVL